MKRALHNISRLLLCGLALLSSARAGQVVLDFDHIPNPNLTNNLPSPVIEDGFRLTSTTSFDMFGPGAAQNTGHKALAPRSTGSGSTTTLTSVSGVPFSLTGIRLSPYITNTPFTAVFVGTMAGGGTVTESHTLGVWNMQGVSFGFGPGFGNVTSVTWAFGTTANNLFQFDDIILVTKPEVSAPAGITVTEGAGTVSIPVTFAEPAPAALNVNYTIANGTATNGSDFTASGTGTITIPQGQQSAALSIQLTNDATSEALENFTITWSPGTGAAAIAGFPPGLSTTVSIANDDGITGFPAWMSAHGLTGNAALPNADPNGDGVSNIESWLCRINPAGPSPQAWLDRRASYFVTAANVPGLRLTVPSPLPSDVRLIFEESTGLASFSEQTRRSGFATGSLWTGSGASRVVESNSLTARTITLPGSATRSARPRAFYRMKYELVSSGGD